MSTMSSFIVVPLNSNNFSAKVTMNFNFLIRQTSMIENNMVSVERIMEYQGGLPKEAAWHLPRYPRTTQLLHLTCPC